MDTLPPIFFKLFPLGVMLVGALVVVGVLMLVIHFSKPRRKGAVPPALPPNV